MSEHVVRTLTASDAGQALALARFIYGGTRHERRTLELVDLALQGIDAECLGLVITGVDGRTEGLVIYGTVGGAPGVVRVTALVGLATDQLAALLRRVTLLDSVRDARMFFCELSNEPVNAHALQALVSMGFTREDRIADYLADGMALDILVLRR